MARRAGAAGTNPEDRPDAAPCRNSPALTVRRSGLLPKLIGCFLGAAMTLPLPWIESLHQARHETKCPAERADQRSDLPAIDRPADSMPQSKSRMRSNAPPRPRDRTRRCPGGVPGGRASQSLPRLAPRRPVLHRRGSDGRLASTRPSLQGTRQGRAGPPSESFRARGAALVALLHAPPHRACRLGTSELVAS